MRKKTEKLASWDPDAKWLAQVEKLCGPLRAVKDDIIGRCYVKEAEHEGEEPQEDRQD